MLMSQSFAVTERCPLQNVYSSVMEERAPKFQKLYKKSGLKSLSWSIPHSVIYSVEDEKDLKIVGDIVKEYIDQTDQNVMRRKAVPKQLLSNFFWMCYTLKDVETAKLIGKL